MLNQQGRDLFAMPKPPAEKGGQALVVDGQMIDEATVRRLIRQLQQAKIALMNECFAHNRTRQDVARLEYELADCGELPVYRITRSGLDWLRDYYDDQQPQGA